MLLALGFWLKQVLLEMVSHPVFGRHFPSLRIITEVHAGLKAQGKPAREGQYQYGAIKIACLAR